MGGVVKGDRTKHRACRAPVQPSNGSAPEILYAFNSAAASSFGIQALVTPVYAEEEIEFVIAAQARDAGGSLIVMPDAFNAANHELIISLAARYGVPALYAIALCKFRRPDLLWFRFRRKVSILRQGTSIASSRARSSGAADPIADQVLVINLRTVKALGLTMPTLLATADEVIE